MLPLLHLTLHCSRCDGGGGGDDDDAFAYVGAHLSMLLLARVALLQDRYRRLLCLLFMVGWFIIAVSSVESGFLGSSWSCRWVMAVAFSSRRNSVTTREFTHAL
jgi:hypothetical protein